MALAIRCLGGSRREWARAMEGEFEAALNDGRPLAFAAGCLMAAWRRMPAQEEGRLALASYAFVLGVLLPMAALQFARALGLPYLLQGPGGLYGMLAASSAQNPYLATTCFSAAPTLVALWLLLGLSHLRIAWALLECDWSGVARFAALAVAASATLAIFTGVLFLKDAGVALQAAVLMVELIATYSIAQWHSRLSPIASSGSVIR
jgi:hypothetical protein